MNKKLLNILLLVAITLIGFSSCERDDICADTTPTTPHLIIRFYNIDDPDELKSVRKLSVRGFDADGNEIETEIEPFADTDSIALPLPIYGEMPTTTQFILEKDRDFFLDEDPLTNSNIDKLTVTYTPQFIYVSRACGYKSIFNDAGLIIEPDADNWILTSENVNTTLDNETVHFILHH